MKILHIGNVGTAYNVVKELRNRGIDADLMVEKEQIYGTLTTINNPLRFDKDLKEIPRWMKIYDKKKKSSRLKIIFTMRKYDIIHAYMNLPILAMFSCKPFISHVVGDDLRVNAFKKNLRGLLLNLAYRKSRRFVFEWIPHKPFLDKLRLKNVIFLPKPWNASNFYREHIIIPKNQVLTIFHPLGQDWKWKGNDKFLKAFERICKDTNKIFLYYIEWGKDVKKASRILERPWVKDKVLRIKGPIERKEMLEYMKKSDIVADQFNSGSFTRTGIESLFFGIPLLMNLDETLHDNIFGDHPVTINTKNEDEIYVEIKKLISDKQNLEDIAKESQKWVKKHYEFRKIIDKFIVMYKEIL